MARMTDQRSRLPPILCPILAMRAYRPTQLFGLIQNMNVTTMLFYGLTRPRCQVPITSRLQSDLIIDEHTTKIQGVQKEGTAIEWRSRSLELRVPVSHPNPCPPSKCMRQGGMGRGRQEHSCVMRASGRAWCGFFPSPVSCASVAGRIPARAPDSPVRVCPPRLLLDG